MKHYLISDKNLWDQIQGDFGDQGGIYKLHCRRTEKSSDMIPINRLLDVDTNGVLYIGCAETFHIRVSDLIKSLSSDYKSTGHDVGKKYAKVSKIQERFPYKDLVVTLARAENPVQEEKMELEKYLQKFGELPPFNAMP